MLALPAEKQNSHPLKIDSMNRHIASYSAPSIEILNIQIERGFAQSGIINYDETDGTEGTGSDYGSSEDWF